MISLVLPYPPSVNQLYRNVAGRGRVKTDRYKTWLRAAGNELLATPPGDRAPIIGPYILNVLAGRPDKRRRDLDNLLKATSDLLVKHGLIDGDHLAVSVTVAWSEQVDPGRALVFVWPYCATRAAMRKSAPLEDVPEGEQFKKMRLQ